MGGPDQLPPSLSAHALHPPVSRSRANVLMIFQCPGIWPTPSQKDILVSGDSLAFLPNYVEQSFYLGRDQSQIRIKSEVGTVKHVEALQFSFYWRRFCRSSLKMLKPGLYPVLW